MSLNVEPRPAAHDTAPPPHRDAPLLRLPWHLRKRFLLPVLALLLLGVLPSLVLQAAGAAVAVAFATGSGLPADVEELRRAASGELPEPAVPAVVVDGALAESAAAGRGDIGEAGLVSYVVEGDLDGVKVTWVSDADGTEQTEKLQGDSWRRTVTMDATWPGVAVTVERERGSGPVSCSIVGPTGDLLDSSYESGRGAVALCAF